jgi:predicted Zn-dependent protease
VIQRLDTLRESNPLAQRTRVLYARALLMAGQQNEALGIHTQARDDWQRLVEFLRADPGSSEPSAQAVLATALLALERVDEASVILVRLDALGYRDPEFVRVVSQRALPRKAGTETVSDTHGAD